MAPRNEERDSDMATLDPTLRPMTGEPVADALVNGTSWLLGPDRVVTWAIANSTGDWAFSSAGAQVFHGTLDAIFDSIADVANIRFRYVGFYQEVTTAPADIVITATLTPTLYGMTSAFQARAYFPNESLSDNEIARQYGSSAVYPNAAGDVVLNMRQFPISASTYAAGSNGYFVLLHEIGHALGLKHPHDGGGTGRPTFAQAGYNVADTQLLSVMSYNEATALASWLASFGLPSGSGYPETPMPLDVLGLQQLYGRNLSTRAGNDTYRLFNDDALSTTWDAGGIDRLTAETSSYGWAIESATTIPGHNIVVAYPTTYAGSTGKFFFDIELLTGSNYNDQISGSELNETLSGLDGWDIIDGGAGNDSINSGPGGLDVVIGGAGNDRLVFQNDVQDYSLSFNRTTGDAIITAKSGELDFVTGVESLQFRNGDVVPGPALGFWGLALMPTASSVGAVFRFFNTRDKAFFYTTSVAERDMVIRNSDAAHDNVGEWPYVYQGSTFEAAHSYGSGTPMHRFYNTATGHHFFTVSEVEANLVKARAASGQWPFVYDGAPFSVYAADPTPGFSGQEAAVFRFYSPTLDRHFFTASTLEADQIRLTGVWTYEGVAFFGEAT